MNAHPCRASRTAGVCAAIALMLTLAIKSQTQNVTRSPLLARPVHIDIKQASLVSILITLTNQAGGSFIIDGEPRRAQADMRFSGRFGDAADLVADLFDYTYKSTKTGVLLFSKRFRDPQERPQANLKEVRQSVKDVLRVLGAVPYDPQARWEVPFEALVQSLTPDQRRALLAGRHIAGTDLMPHQQNLLRQAVWTNTFALTGSAWKRLSDQLGRLEDSQLASIENPLRGGTRQRSPKAIVLYTPTSSGRRVTTYVFPPITSSLIYQGGRK
jgi:hypothetical protein